MPAPIDEIVKRRVIQQWLAGEAREKIIADNDVASGTVSIIVDEYKMGLDNFDLDSFRELTLEQLCKYKVKIMLPPNSSFRENHWLRLCQEVGGSLTK